MTHNLSFLDQTDLVVVLNNGEISETGTYEELLRSKGAFSVLMMDQLTVQDKQDETDADPGK